MSSAVPTRELRSLDVRRPARYPFAMAREWTDEERRRADEEEEAHYWATVEEQRREEEERKAAREAAEKHYNGSVLFGSVNCDKADR